MVSAFHHCPFSLWEKVGMRAALASILSIIASAFHHCPFSLREKVGMRVALTSILSPRGEEAMVKSAGFDLRLF
ncbi:MAG: hypothetical protein K8H75_03670 [Sulfuricella sp.]|nr:hypothetical protein [Sulfuricella sp.]